MTAATAITPMTWRKTWDQGKDAWKTLIKQQNSQKAPLLLCGLPLGHWGLFSEAEQEKLFQLYLCETIMDIQ